MDPFMARTMVESLSKGINPITGCALPLQDICSDEEVQDALLEVLEHCSIESVEQFLVRNKEEKEAVRKAKRRENAKRYPRGGEPWSAEEESKLLYLHRKGCNTYRIANILKRTPMAISTHLRELGSTPICRNSHLR